MDTMWDKLGDRSSAFRRLSDTEKYEILMETFQTVYKGLPLDEKLFIKKMIQSLIVKNGNQQCGVIKRVGEKSLIELIEHIGILLAGMPDGIIDGMIYERRRRKTLSSAACER